MSVNYNLYPKEGILYVDHQKNNRSGHMGHALVEYKKGQIMSFYCNCSSGRNFGHNSFGWFEYKTSSDGGRTWSQEKKLPYSWEAFLNEPFTISCEKAVSTRDDEVIVFCTRNTNPNGWQPFLNPTVVISNDGGNTWGEPFEFCEDRGRIYDALVVDGVIYVLFHASENWYATAPEHEYRIYQSTDNGKTFTKRGVVPLEAVRHAYGNMILRDDGALICYVYNELDEQNMNYFMSYDMGATWTESGKSYCAKRIRNPQVAKVNGGFLLHGRSGHETTDTHYFVLYTSTDGINWDEGKYICEKEGKIAYYSNNLVMEEDGKQRVLIQASVPYEQKKVNIYHWFLDIL